MKKKPLKTSILLLSKRLSKTNKQRNGIIVIAMISTMLLLTMLFHITTSIFAIMREQSLREIGTLAEGAYKNITKNQYSKISESDLINDISYNVFIGNCVSTEKFGVKTEIRYSEEKAAAWNFCNLEKGHFPTKENEIVVDDIFLDCLEYKADLSDRIQIQITTESGVLDKEFEICGFYHGNRLSAVSELYVSEIFLNLLFDSQKNENRNNNIQAFCRLNTTKSVEKILTDAWNKAGIAENCDIAVNWAYRNISLTPAIFLVIILLLFVIILSGYLIIYNVFYISITNDIQFYGQLKIIGMESKQIKYLLIIQISRLLVVAFL